MTMTPADWDDLERQNAEQAQVEEEQRLADLDWAEAQAYNDEDW